MFRTMVLAAMASCCAVASSYATEVSGDIEVYNGSTLLGYVSDTYDGQNSFTYTSSVGSALGVEIDPSLSLFSITATNPPDSGHALLGAVGGSGGYYFSPSQTGYAYLAGTGASAAGPPSSTAGTSLQVLGYNGPSEATIWGRSGNTLTALWENTDDTTDQATLFYDPVVNYLGITGDLTGYNSTYGDNASAVSFVFTGTFPATAVPEPGSLAILGGALAAGLFLRRRAPA